MRTRILQHWTFRRGLFIAMGVFVIVQSILNEQWLGLAFGGYFAAMGLFAFGCASGNCIGGTCETAPRKEENHRP